MLAFADIVDALLTELEQAETILRQIADPSYVGNYSDAEMIEIYRKWATREAGRI